MSKKIDYRSSRIADQIRKGINGDWFDFVKYMVTKFDGCDLFVIEPEDAWLYRKDGTYGVLVASGRSWSHYRSYALGRA